MWFFPLFITDITCLQPLILYDVKTYIHSYLTYYIDIANYVCAAIVDSLTWRLHICSSPEIMAEGTMFSQSRHDSDNRMT